MKMDCDNLYGWIKKIVTYTKILLNMVNPTDIAGNAEEEEEEEEALTLKPQASGWVATTVPIFKVTGIIRLGTATLKADTWPP